MSDPVSVEKTLARMTLPTDEATLPPALDFVRRVAEQNGLSPEESESIGRAAGTVCRNVIRYAFDPGEDGTFDVEIVRRPGKLVVAVEDRGLPFDYVRLQHDEEADPPDTLGHAFSDEVKFINLGRNGNRVELIRNTKPDDVREELPEGVHREVAEAGEVPVSVEPEIRLMRPEESTELSRCVYRSYGYSYDADYVYYPERIRELQEGGVMRSCVAVGPEGDFIGHLAATLPAPDSPVAEAGQAVVDPRFRGHKLFEKMKLHLMERAGEWGWYGLYSEATAVHPYSQRGGIKLGSRETGFLLGYIPATVAYNAIGEERAGRRGSVCLFYTKTNEEPQRDIYPPPEYREVISRINDRNSLNRTEGAEEPVLSPESRLVVEVRRDHNFAFIRIEERGEDLEEKLRFHLRELCMRRVDCIYADFPLSSPTTRDVGGIVGRLGFFFGGVVPELSDGDILRFQYLNEVEILPEDVKTGSDFGQELLEFILHRKAEAEV